MTSRNDSIDLTSWTAGLWAWERFREAADSAAVLAAAVLAGPAGPDSAARAALDGPDSEDSGGLGSADWAADLEASAAASEEVSAASEEVSADSAAACCKAV